MISVVVKIAAFRLPIDPQEEGACAGSCDLAAVVLMIAGAF
jgi:hypothetical protein